MLRGRIVWLLQSADSRRVCHAAYAHPGPELRLLQDRHATDPKLYESNLTQLFGGFSVAYTLNLQNTQYVDVQCIEITSHNGLCVTMGAPAYPRGCNTSQPLDDYAGTGVLTNNATANVTFQDVYIHGFDSSGLFARSAGPLP